MSVTLTLVRILTKGLSLQQRRILEFLKTKQFPNSDRGYFTIQEIMTDFSIEYVVWLMEVKKNPWLSNQKDSIDYGKHDKVRISMYRALRSLEKRGLVVSFMGRPQNRFWAVPNRLKEITFGSTVFHEMRWVEQDKERWRSRQVSWKWAVFIRNLPEQLHLKYKLRIWNKEEAEEIKRLWAESNPTKS